VGPELDGTGCLRKTFESTDSNKVRQEIARLPEVKHSRHRRQDDDADRHSSSEKLECSTGFTADQEDQYEPREKESYIINKLDRTVLMIDSPGPRADSQGCMGVLGKPKTVVYKLQQ
jgi:hypothetical protein